MQQKEWYFDAGNLVLDFTNTAEFHASKHPDEMLETYPDLLAWSLEAGILNQSEARALMMRAEKNPKESSKKFESVIALREIIYRMLSSAAKHEPIEASDLAGFNQFLSKTMLHSKISRSGEKFSWSWDEDGDPGERIQWTLVREAANLITSEEIKRIGECEDDRGCGFLFIDTSRNHSRRWCSMESCGNRAKAQRYYQKKSKK